jgi:hypothetical protein
MRSGPPSLPAAPRNRAACGTPSGCSQTLGANRKPLNLERDFTYGFLERLGAKEELSDRDRDRRRRKERLLPGADQLVDSLDQSIGHRYQGTFSLSGGRECRPCTRILFAEAPSSRAPERVDGLRGVGRGSGRRASRDDLTRTGREGGAAALG